MYFSDCSLDLAFIKTGNGSNWEVETERRGRFFK